LAEGKDTVISVQTSPLVAAEPACVALQLGTGLLNAGSRVTIFATLGGVGVAHRPTVENEAILCQRVDQSGKLLSPVPLKAVVDGYLAAGGEILACPLCWVVAYGELPDSAELLYKPGDQVYITSPIPLLSTADRVIDY
jgi:predicted peroxiredoxin